MTAATSISLFATQHPHSPHCAKSDEVFLTGSRAAGVLTLTTLAANYTLYGIVQVPEQRRLHFHIAYDAVTSAASARPGIIIRGAATRTQPADTDDAWFALGFTDGSLTATTLAGTVPAPGTATPQWGAAQFESGMILTRAVSAATDKIRFTVSVNVEPYNWIMIMAAEHGDTSHLGKIAISFTVSV